MCGLTGISLDLSCNLSFLLRPYSASDIDHNVN
jgi:hypothetical protein